MSCHAANPPELRTLCGISWGMERLSCCFRGMLMPFKDPEKRREYHRQYKRRQRARLTNPGNPVRKCYVCPDIPGLVLHLRAFRNGFYITDDPGDQAIIEGHQYYGWHIFAFQVEP
jgi:hypothetical protein